VTWTREQKQAYAIKKRMERAGRNRHPGANEPVAPALQPAPGFQVHPANHRCRPHEITYGVDRTQCNVCGRRWTRVRTGGDAIGNSYYKYEVSPVTRRQPPR